MQEGDGAHPYLFPALALLGGQPAPPGYRIPPAHQPRSRPGTDPDTKTRKSVTRWRQVERARLHLLSEQAPLRRAEREPRTVRVLRISYPDRRGEGSDLHTLAALMRTAAALPPPDVRLVHG